MSVMWRYRQAGATFAYAFDNLQELRQRMVVAGAPTISASPFGPVLTVDGAADYVTLSTAWEANLRFDSGAQDFSLVVWFRLGATGAIQTLFDKREAADDGYVLFVDASDNLQFSLDAIDVSGAATLVANTWYCGIITVDRSGNGQLYLNGATDGAAVAIGGEVMATTTAPRVGAESFGAAANKLDGQVASVVLIDRLLTATEAASIAAGQAWDYDRGLVSAWNMSDINTPDVGFIGQGADMTGVGLVAASDVVQGIHGNSMATEYNGVDEYSRRAEADWRSQDTQGSIVAWIKLAAAGAPADTIFCSADEVGANNFFLFEINVNDRLRILTRNGAGTDRSVRGGSTLAAGVWYHVVLTSNGTVWAIYLNGIAETITVVTVSNAGTWLGGVTLRSNVVIGALRRAVAANLFGGVIDGVRYYSQPLTQLQATDLYVNSRRGIIR